MFSHLRRKQQVYALFASQQTREAEVVRLHAVADRVGTSQTVEDFQTLIRVMGVLKRSVAQRR